MVGDVAGTAAEAGIAVRLDDVELRDRLEAALDAILADGTYDAVRKRYFDFDIFRYIRSVEHPDAAAGTGAGPRASRRPWRSAKGNRSSLMFSLCAAARFPIEI
jgi:hypothetical protein